MSRRSLRVQFPGLSGNQLAGIIELPAHEPDGFFLFSHCFTCSKDLKAIVKLSRGLADYGWGVLRYDFTGLGNSQGDFSKTNFTTNCQDLYAAVQFLGRDFSSPEFLIGHSFGGAASLAMASELPTVRGVVAIGAPSDTRHLAELLLRMDPGIQSTGTGSVVIGGQSFQIDQQMIEDFRSHDLPWRVANLQKPLLALHSPTDETVMYKHALANCGMTEMPISHATLGNRTLVNLPMCNHLFTDKPESIPFALEAIDHWCRLWFRGESANAAPA